MAWKNVQYENGKYRTSSGGGGDSSHDYSTTEQVVGTWLDGNTLYEKSYVISALPSSAGYSDTSLGLSNISVKRSFGDIYFSTGTTRPLGTVTKSDSGADDSTNGITFQIVTNSAIRIFVGKDRSTVSAVVTIQYTKTTD